MTFAGNASSASSHAVRFLANRLLNVIRPKPQMIPLSVEQVLSSQSATTVVERFNDLCYSGGIFKLNWQGLELLKNPCDLWMSLDLIQRLRPTVIFETGTHFGGSACFYADVARMFDIDTKIITVDVNPKWAVSPAKRGIESIVGYSTSPEVVAKVDALVAERLANQPGHVMAFLDSDHSAANVLKELQLYSRLVTVGSYCVVEDTNVNGHPSFPSHGPGPWEATEAFLQEHASFTVDLECERYLLTFNPRGWLKRVR